MKKLFAIAGIVGLITFNVPLVAFAIAPATPPTITSINPSSGPTSGGTSVTIVGTDLGGASVTIGGTAATSVVVAGNQKSLTASTPAGTSGAKDVVVTTADGSATLTNGFTYTAVLTSQTITVTTSAPSTAEYNSTFPVAANSSSGLAVAISTTGNCSVSSGTVTMTAGTGSCVVHYNQAGDSTYAAATEITETVTATTKSLTPSITASNKTYDGTNIASTNCQLSGVVSGDTVTCSVTSATFADSNAGTGKEVTATGISLSGASAAHYSLSATGATTAADIAQATLTYAADTKSRVYGQADPVFTGTVNGFVGSDNLGNSTTGTLTFTTPATASSNVGTYAINGSGLTVTSANYSSTIAQASGNANAFSITKATALIVINDITQIFTGSSKTVTAVTTPSGLTVNFTYNGSGTAPSAVGSYAVVGTVNDTNYEGTENATLQITNNTPTATASSSNTNEDTAVIITLAGDDGEASETQTLTFAIGTNPSQGVLSGLNSTAGTVTYTPNANYNGPDSFTFTVHDGAETSAPATVSITVDPVNDTPSFTVGTDQTIPQDSAAQTVNGWATAISAGPADEVGQTLNFTVTNNANSLFSVQPAVSSAGDLTYTPAPSATGTATVSVSLYDNGGGVNTSAVQTFTITLSKVNVAPVVTGQSVTTNEDTAKAIALIGSDANTDAITYSIVSGPTHGMLGTIVGNQVTYTPNADYNGPDSFTFKGTDVDFADSTTETVSITVNSVNDTPSFTKGTDRTVNEDAGGQAVASWATNISAGPSDESAQAVDFIVSNNNNALFSAQPEISAAGTLTYTPADDAYGVATVSVSLHDNGGGADTSVVQTFTITVNAVNDAPVLNLLSDDTIDEHAASTFTASATDVDSGALMYSLSGEPNGASIDSGTGVFTWTPDESQGGYGPYTFDVLASDGSLSDSQSITITVNEVNAAPSADALSITTDEDTAVSGTVTGSDSDDPIQTLTFAVATGPSNGTLTSFDGSTGSFTYEPDANYSGSDSFTFTAHDGVATSSSATVSVTVNSINDLPVITLNGSTPLLLSQYYDDYTDEMATATDVEDGNISASTTASRSLDTSVVGTYTITYTIVDSDGGSASVDREVTIVPQVGGSGGSSGEVGCRDPRATNYSATARYDGIACVYPAPIGEVLGASTSTPPTVGTGNPTQDNPGHSLEGIVLGETKFIFTRTLRFGSRGEDVRELQKILISQGFLKVANPSSYFGGLTRAALMKWQTENGLPSTGLFGTMSRAILNK